MTSDAPPVGLSDIESFIVPWEAVQSAHAHLRLVGEEGEEGFALWAGVRDGTTFRVRETVIPEQTAHITPYGVCVSVSGAELRRIGAWLFENGLQLVAQLHSHPGAAYHSETDDALPIVATAGALSLVVPDYAREPFALARCAVYRLARSTGWEPVTAADAARLITITGSPQRGGAEAAGRAEKGKGGRGWDWLRTLGRRR